MPALKPAERFEGKRKGRLVPVADATRKLAESLSVSSGAFRVQDIQERFRRNLNGGSEELFREFTGLRFEILWEACGLLAEGASLVAGRGSERCACDRGRLASERGENGALTVPGQQPPTSRVCACYRGAQNFSHPIEMDGLRLGVAVVQASQREPMKGKACSTVVSYDRGDAANGGAQFQRATMLLQLVVHDAVAATLAELRSEELARARDQVASVERKSRRRPRGLQRAILQPSHLAGERQERSGIPAVVSLILDFVHAAYPQPISLKDFARDHELNPSYLSTAFSSNVGVPFKKFLTDFRVKKAGELLRNPTAKISEVAAAVGYTNQNRFLAIFKAATGVSPSAFRRGEALR